MKITGFIYFLVQPIRALYWRICRPNTFGVRVLIIHPTRKNNILLIRHTYGDRTLWNIPGGGYKPTQETPEQAIERETKEEVGLTLDTVEKVGEYYSDNEGKRDAVILFKATVKNADLKISGEIAEAIWIDYKTLTGRTDVAKVTVQAIEDSFGIVLNP